MSEQTPSQQNATVEPPARGKESSPAGWLARASLTQLTLAVLTVVFLWQWFDSQRTIGDMREQLARKIAEMDGMNKAGEVLLAQTRNEVRDLSAKLALLETQQAEVLSQRAALETLYADLAASRDETALAEVEQMLMIAGQQLQLSGNTRAALIAMQNADARLQRMERPALDGLRKAIAQDMERLRAVPVADVTALHLQLDSLTAAIDKLPLIYQPSDMSEPLPPAEVPQGSAWERMRHEMWTELRQLVRIRDTGKAEVPLLPPEQEFFLRENLKLRLLMARIALLSRDAESYARELKTAQQWLARYFDVRAEKVAKALGGLKKLAATEITGELPDIGRSLQAVRSYRLTHEAGQAARASGKKAAQ